MQNLKKTAFTVAFLFVLLFSSLASSFPLNTVHASTNISGIIASDATWTNVNGPFNLTNNVLIDNDVTVTVEAEAIVNLNGYYIRVNGTLLVQSGVTINMGVRGTSLGFIQVNGVMTARGTGTNPILFNGSEYFWDSFLVPPSYSWINFEEPSLAWNEQTGSGCIIENAVLSKTGIRMSSSMKFCNNTLSDAGIGITSGSPVISDNVILKGISIAGGSPLIANNLLNGSYISIEDSHGIDSPVITSNVFSNPNPEWPYSTSACISMEGNFRNNNGLVLIEKNNLTNSRCGIELNENDNIDVTKPITIRYNTIINNEVGIAITDKFSPTIINNNIYNNNASIKLSSFASRDINASNNWWGTTDTSIIDSLIYDFNDGEFDLGKVNYSPILTEAEPQAKPDPNAPTTTPSPTPTPTQSTSPTPSSTPTSSPITTPSPNPTASPQPSIDGVSWEEFYGIVTTLVVVVAVLAVAIVVLIYKNRKIQTRR